MEQHPQPHAEISSEKIIPFGKHKGQCIADIPSGYLNWLLEQEWFEAEKWNVLWDAITDEIEVRDRCDSHFDDEIATIPSKFE